MREILDKYKGFIFDMDGTLYLEEKMIDGAVDVLNYLINKGKHLLFVTNKTTSTRSEYTNFFNKIGVEISKNQILTAANNCIKYLEKEFVGKKFYAIAENSFINSITDAGLNYTEKPVDVKIVIITLDRNYSDKKFEIAKKAILNGANFIAANIDNTCPVIGGEINDAGVIISNLERETGNKLANHFGKPSNYMIMALKEKMKLR